MLGEYWCWTPLGLKGLNELPFLFENISSYPFIFPNCTKLNSLDIPASTNQCQGLLDMHTQLRPTKQIIDSLVEIKYTLSILQVYFICTSQKKSTFEVYLVCTSRKKV